MEEHLLHLALNVAVSCLHNNSDYTNLTLLNKSPQEGGLGRQPQQESFLDSCAKSQGRARRACPEVVKNVASTRSKAQLGLQDRGCRMTIKNNALVTGATGIQVL